MAMQYKVVSALALILLVSLAATRAADGEIPTAADFAVCNEEAPEAAKAGTASPIMGDHVRAGRARAGVRTINSSDVTESHRIVRSTNPRHEGGRSKGRHVPGRLSQLHETEGLLSQRRER